MIASRTLRMAARQWWAILLMIATVVPLSWCGVPHVDHVEAARRGAAGLPACPRPTRIVILPGGTMTLAFLLALFAGAGQVADDTRAGAFQFYFARPVTRDQYLVGKVVPVLTLTLFITLGPALLLSLLRLALLPNGRGGAAQAAARGRDADHRDHRGAGAGGAGGGDLVAVAAARAACRAGTRSCT